MYQHKMEEMLSSMLLGAPLQDSETQVPAFHKEYKERYPSESMHYYLLSIVYSQVRAFGIEEGVIELDAPISGAYLAQRYGSLSPMVLKAAKESRTTKSGDILRRPSSTNETGTQTFRNVVYPQLIMNGGKTTVVVGLVDLGDLLRAALKDEEEGSCQFVGFASNPFHAAKTLVVLQLLKNKASTKDIIQVWFSSGWSNSAQKSFKKAVKALLNDGTSKSKEVASILKHWSGTNPVSTELSREEWIKNMTIDELPANLANKNDRVQLCRYLLTGELFPEDVTVGSIAMFDSPSFVEHKAKSESIFHFIPIIEHYEHSAKKSMTLFERAYDYLLSSIEKLQDWIVEGKVNATIHHQAITPTDGKEAFDKVKALDPYTVIWGNIPDYLVPTKFHLMAKACSGTKTLHFVHFLNWSAKVIGTELNDYASAHRLQIYYQAKKWRKLNDSLWNSPLIRSGDVLTHYRNIADQFLCKQRKKDWINYYFRDHVGESQIQEVPQIVSIFERMYGVLLIGFTYASDVTLRPEGEELYFDKAPGLFPMATCANPECGEPEDSPLQFHKCSQCKKLYYCGRACQAAHWKNGHKQQCKK